MNGLLAVAAPAAAGMAAGTVLAWACALMVLAAALAITEFLIVSWGMLLIAAVISCISAIALAFHVSPLAGWIFVIISPAIAVLVVRTGLGLMRRNRAAVIAAEITADAGYIHAPGAAGIAVGTIGELATPATPSGRARFAGRHGPVELDVRVQGRGLERGDRVVVLALDGAAITVAEARDTVSGIITSEQPSPKV